MSSRTKLSLGRYDFAAYLTFFAYAAGSVIVPVSLVELARGLDFDLSRGGMTAGGGLQLGRAATMVVAMLLVGFIAGRWGTRRTLGVSVLLMSVGVAMCAVSPVYGVLLLAMLFAGVGEGVIEGLATPFVQNLHPKEPGRYINLTHAFWSVGILATVLVSGWFLSLGYSWRILTGVVAGIGSVAGLLILWPMPGSRKYPEKGTRLSIGEVGFRMRAIVCTRRFWVFYVAMFLAGGGEFCLTFWSASHIQLHFGTGPMHGGFGVALFALAMVIGRFAAGYFVPQERLRSLILFAATGGAIVTAILPWVNQIEIFYLLLFLAGLATAPFWPSIQSYATEMLPGLDSTLLLILLSCAGVPGCGVLTYVMGMWGDFSGSLAPAFVIVPIAYGSIWILFGFIGKEKDRAPGK
tara:strand:+ start:40257 stop:41477 length:1221 start_codon:yes stop_codon:yes gene_type:complete